MQRLIQPIFAGAFLLALASCSHTSPEQAGDQSNGSPVSESALPAKLAGVFKKELSLPLTVDSAFLAGLQRSDSIGAGEVRLLDTGWPKHDLLSSLPYDLREFYRIDSIKQSGTYAKWCETLDIGMTKFANAYAIGRIAQNPTTSIFVWALTSSSYEACPSSSRQSVFCTVFRRGRATSSFLLGESGAFADPPVAMEYIIKGSLDPAGNILLEKRQVNDEDMDEPFIYITRERYEFALKDAVIVFIKEKKGSQEKVARPKQDS